VKGCQIIQSFVICTRHKIFDNQIGDDDIAGHVASMEEKEGKDC
jgi:hypothetical protein